MQRLLPPHQRHLSTRPWQVTQPIPFVQVNAVVEVDKIWQVVDSAPGRGRPVRKLSRTGSSMGALSPDLGMTVHTGFGGRDAGKGCLLPQRYDNSGNRCQVH